MAGGRTPLTGEPPQATAPVCLGTVWSGMDGFRRLDRFGSIYGSGAVLYTNNSLMLQTWSVNPAAIVGVQRYPKWVDLLNS
jgi:hypothetical protein